MMLPFMCGDRKESGGERQQEHTTKLTSSDKVVSSVKIKMNVIVWQNVMPCCEFEIN
jgi:hypothetical protein